MCGSSGGESGNDTFADGAQHMDGNSVLTRWMRPAGLSQGAMWRRLRCQAATVAFDVEHGRTGLADGVALRCAMGLDELRVVSCRTQRYVRW